ncbi:ArsR/SmtB family transcription factor [Serinicoccus marinus]|uniref:ArsR/SmtB family transcription factor n=1 Tax=Serinicoccus marinus TaxID=247333 RepID=UPI0024928426|nr:metalloregulator ArsR/SmtB family transcription factor [Serinicoccus marinus]
MNTLEAAAAAVASEPRRRLLERLAEGPATVSDLADHVGMSLPTVLRHLERLEDGGLVSRSKRGRTVHVRLVPGALEPLAQWAMRTRLFWGNHLDRYAAHLGERPGTTTAGETP